MGRTLLPIAAFAIALKNRRNSEWSFGLPSRRSMRLMLCFGFTLLRALRPKPAQFNRPPLSRASTAKKTDNKRALWTLMLDFLNRLRRIRITRMVASCFFLSRELLETSYHASFFLGKNRRPYPLTS